MKKRMLMLTKVSGVTLVYFLVFVTSIFLTMSWLIKGEEVTVPDLVGKSLTEAYEIAWKKGIKLKKVEGDFGSTYPANSVVHQQYPAGTRVKERSFLKIFVASEVVDVIVPSLVGISLREGIILLKNNRLKRGYVSYSHAEDVPVDTILAQSYNEGTRIPENESVDLLVSMGPRNRSFMMPDLIGQDVEKVVVFFERKGLKISKITYVSYYGLRLGIVINQHPPQGHEISSRNLISLEVSE